MKAVFASPVLAGIAICVAGSFPGRAAEALLPGAYDVDVHLEMSFGEDKPERRTVCLASGGKPALGLFILTPGTPISACPVRNVVEAADQIAFEIVCEGPNSGTATAEYRTASDRFEGRIAMLMGGKNMRMTEVQVGRRIGACQNAHAEPGR